MIRKQKAKEKSSRQSDVMSDRESIDVMLGNFLRIENQDQQTDSEKKLTKRQGDCIEIPTT